MCMKKQVTKKYHRQYAEHLQALGTTLRLIDGILEDRSPLLDVAANDRRRQLAHLREAKVTLSILAHALQRAMEGRI
ncbi:MAG: hypothetical protein HY304_01995 [candidate division Zixibacteria bacterium]|nr:hypothetical protein [candidate division Zixibacteria bacterium]